MTPILSPRWKNLLRICGHLCLFRAILQSYNIWTIYLEQLGDIDIDIESEIDIDTDIGCDELSLVSFKALKH